MTLSVEATCARRTKTLAGHAILPEPKKAGKETPFLPYGSPNRRKYAAVQWACSSMMN